MEALRPPVEQGGGAVQDGTGLEADTASRLDILQLLDGGEMRVHQDGIGEGPQMLGGLEF